MSYGSRFFFPVLILLSACQGSRNTSPQVTAPAPQLGGGGSSDVGSAGENNPRDHLAAWFTGKNKVIQACFEVAADFGVRPEVAHDTVLEAFEKWAQYLETHHVRREEERFPGFSTRINLKSTCDASSELKFFFGVENAEVEAARKQFVNPTAFVQRLSFDASIPLGKGFIWIAKQAALRSFPAFPDWSREGRLLAILMHEIGHVYGNDHIPGTIMAGDISEQLDSKMWSKPLTSIDHCRELLFCEYCDYISELDISTTEYPSADFFRKLADGPLADKLSFRLHRSHQGKFQTLQLSDSEATYRFLVTGGLPRPVHGSGLKIFKVVQEKSSWAYSDQSFVQYASVIRTGAKPSRVAVMSIEYNLSSCSANADHWRTPVEVSVIGAYEAFPLAPFSWLYPRSHTDFWDDTPMTEVMRQAISSPLVSRRNGPKRGQVITGWFSPLAYP